MLSAGSKNVRPLDRIFRFVLAIVLLGFALFCPFAQSLGAGAVWGSGLVGAIFFVTALVGFCPLYRLVGR